MRVQGQVLLIILNSSDVSGFMKLDPCRTLYPYMFSQPYVSKNLLNIRSSDTTGVVKVKCKVRSVRSLRRPLRHVCIEESRMEGVKNAHTPALEHFSESNRPFYLKEKT